MTKKDAVRLFEDRQVRSVWDSDAEKWYVSVIDVIFVYFPIFLQPEDVV